MDLAAIEVEIAEAEREERAAQARCDRWRDQSVRHVMSGAGRSRARSTTRSAEWGRAAEERDFWRARRRTLEAQRDGLKSASGTLNTNGESNASDT